MKIIDVIENLEDISSLIKKSKEEGERCLNYLSIELGISEEELKEVMKNALLDKNRNFN